MTQNARLLNYLERNDGITTAEASDKLRVFRLSQRIIELEALGYRISHTPETTSAGARVIRYRLIGHTNVSPKEPASAAPDEQLITAYGRSKDGKPITFQYVAVGFAHGKFAR